MKRFVIVQNSLRTTYIFRKAYIKKLLEEGTVSIVAPVDDDYSYKMLSDLGVYIYNVPALGASVFSKLKSIFYMNYFIFLERRNDAIIICHFIVTFLMCYLSLIPFNKKCVVYIEGLGSLFSKQSIFRDGLCFIIGRNSIIRLFCNEDERQILGQPYDKITGGIGIDITKFSVPFKQFENASEFKLLYVGRLIEDKGVLDAVEVLRNLLLKGKNVRLTLVGDVYLSNSSSLNKDDIIRLELEFGNKIYFAGYSNDVVDWYRDSDILLLPSIREGFPVCVMEASSIGIPTVGYEVPGMLESVRSGVNGFLVPFRDCFRLTEMVDSLLDHSKLIEIQSRAQVFAKSYFCQDLKAREIVRILNSI